MSKLLIVVDMQNDFITGSLGTPKSKAIVPNVEKKIREYQNCGNEIIFTRDSHFNNYLETQEGKNLPVTHCIYGTNGWEILDELNVSNCTHVDKKSFGYAYWRDLLIHYDFDEIELIGVCTDICVVSNALILKTFYPEVKITVDASCCAGVTPETHKAALETMKMCQINVIGE